MNNRWKKEHEAGENCLVMTVPLHSKQVQRGGTSIALPILDLGARSGLLVNTMPRLLKPCERDFVHLVQEAGWVQKMHPLPRFKFQAFQPVVNWLMMSFRVFVLLTSNY